MKNYEGLVTCLKKASLGLNVSRKTKKIRHEAKKLTNDRCLSQNKERNKLLALRWLKPPAFSPSLNTYHGMRK